MTKNNLAQKRLFLFDIDGTLSVGDTLFEGSRQLLSYIEDIGGKSYFITNNSTKSPADYVEKFRASFGLVATKQQFMTSGQVTLDFLKTHFHDQTIFCVGTASYITQLRSQGIRVTQVPEESVACVLVAYDDELTYEKLVYACRILCTKDVPYYATNPDLCCPSAFGF
ncbi:MAG: haloacid dehalogenase, partial [Lachnospiraceae bacterium]|nr:haloacid dehalogenase [Lachnospiraceae bacterium]